MPEFQTRNDYGEIMHYSTFIEAYNAYIIDPTIWKISFELDDGQRNRWVTKKTTDTWSVYCETKLRELSPIYNNEHGTRNFWVHQKIQSPEWFEISNDVHLSEEEKEIKKDISCLVQIATEDEFKEMFS